MNTPIITRAKRCTNLVVSAYTVATAATVLIGASILASSSAEAEWKVDFSRRTQQTRTQDLREPASSELPVDASPNQQQPPGFFESLFQPSDIAQEIVVLNTDKGFVPSTIRVKKGMNYQIHIVNVNEKEKNVSFVLDSFSEHHATFFGKIKSFVIRPQKEGVFKFNSPETSAQGKLVVFPTDTKTENRAPASE